MSETLQHIEEITPAIARLGKVSEITPPTEVAVTLRLVARDLSEWQSEYRTLRAKMLVRNVSQAQHTEVNRRYKSAIEDVRLKLEQAERRLTRRSNAYMFQGDLQRVRQIVREL